MSNYDPRNPFGDLNQTSDQKYYASRNPSALSGSRGGDGVGRPGQPPVSRPDPPKVHGDTDTDQYYREGGSAAQRRMMPKSRPVPPPIVAGRQRQSAVPVYLKAVDRLSLREAVKQAINKLAAGEPQVVVDAATNALEVDVRTGIELAVARNQITPAQAGRLVTRVVPSTAPAIAPPEPSKVPAAKEDEDVVMPDDFAAFLTKDEDEPSAVKPAAPAIADDGTDGE